MWSLERKRRKVGRPNLWQWLTQKFKLEIYKEDELRDVVTRSVTRLDGFVLFLVLVAVVSVLAVMVYRNSPSQRRQADRDYLLHQQMVSDVLRIDSINEIVSMRDNYIRGIQDILLGRINADSVRSIDSVSVVDPNLQIEPSDIEKEFVSRYEEQEKYNVTSQAPVASEVQTRNLFRPTRGTISGPFDAQNRHYGVDIAANPNESVISVMDGTVITSNYTAEYGFQICIHHPGDMVSVYRYCNSLLKKEGDKVKGGDVIALVGNTQAGQASSHLHFELWYEGQPVDPAKYIVF